MAAKQFDAVVIGAGPGGYVSAIRLGQLGVKTLVVERGNVGGVCLNWGCIPSKAFIHVAKLYEEIQHAAEFGILVDKPKIDAKKLQEWKEGIVTQLTGGVAGLLKANGVKKLEGTARFKDANTLIVEKGGKEAEIGFKHCVIATGGRPIEIPGFSIDGDTVLGAKGALALEEIPDDLVIIGGGVIGIEMGTFFSKLGANVSIVEMTDRILPGRDDDDVIRPVAKNLKKKGVNVLTSAKATGWTSKDGKAVVSVETKDGAVEIPADKILLAVGVRPNTSDLNLDAAGVKLTDHGFVEINEQCRTTSDSIFAIGDATGHPLLAHKASKQGLVAAEVIAGQNSVYDVRAMPAAIFSDPEIATVGLTVGEAKEQGYDVKVGKFPFSASGRALAMANSDGFVKLIRDAKTDLLLGLHIVGPNASDIIAEGALAIELGATAEDLALTVHAHPTLPECIMEAAEHSHGLAVHTINRK